MALLSPFQRGLSLHTAAWEPLLSSPASSLLLGAHRRFSACARCVGGKDWWFWFLLCELYLRTFFFIGGSMAPSRLHPLSVVHFQSTLFQPPPLQAPACLHIALFVGGSGPGANGRGWRKGPGSPVPLSISWRSGLCLSSAWVAAGVEGPLLRGQASKEGVQQGLRQCNALGRVEF